jgi:hypothetical protein
MPTNVEWTALCEQCTWTWTTENGVNGYQVKGPNGNSIFLPAAGNRYGTNLTNVGSRGLYWSSSLLTDFPQGAHIVYLFSDEVGNSGNERYSGFSIRPVTE